MRCFVFVRVQLQSELRERKEKKTNQRTLQEEATLLPQLSERNTSLQTYAVQVHTHGNRVHGRYTVCSKSHGALIFVKVHIRGRKEGRRGRSRKEGVKERA